MTARWQNNRYVWLGLIALVVLCFLLVIFAPSSGIKVSGSTYSRAPEGYLGWYSYMQERGTPVQRWQRPSEELLDAGEGSASTLVRIYSGLVSDSVVLAPAWVDDWLAAGNTLVALGALSAYGASVVALLWPTLGWECFFDEPVMLLSFILLGRTLEQRARFRATVCSA